MTTDEKIKAITTALAVATLVWSAYSFIQLRAVEAAKPYLEKKLAWCEDAVKVTSRLANASPMQPADVETFWQMYWGVMGLIEKDSITNAMIAFGKDLPAPPIATSGGNAPGAAPASLKTKSLTLAHACRQELSQEWSPSWSRD
jgi:hypothetical protein